MKTHESQQFKSIQQQEVIVMGKQGDRGKSQKPLTDIIKEA